MRLFVKKFILIIILTFNYSNLNANENVKIVLKINEEIITNFDIQNEYNYLVALNNDFKKIPKKKALKIASNSLIKEKIKKIEIEKYYDLSKELETLPNIIKNLYRNIGVKNINEFKNYLKKYNLNYLDVRKKLNIETTWNSLIYTRYNDQVKIDSKKLKKILLTQKSEQNSYLISEILFNKDIEESIIEKYKKIKVSIKKNGFKNSANIYSIAESAKLGGKVGWINESQFSKEIVLKIKKIKIGQYTDPITLPSGNLILMLEDIKKVKSNLDVDKELKILVNYERNKQLNQLSNIFFNKIKNNTLINEI
jgi:peptidyl-prolyl cis-trans isomerase SurA|tara:strand:- start:958 stop:1887 length:930 start_codon:yes stop_codon:yes gene_type:complete